MITMNIKRLLTLALISFALVSAPTFSLLRTPVAVTALAASREPVRARHGIVASTNEVASQVGVDIMRHGGNAIDAAIAVAFALAVTHPAAGNLGGGGFMMIRLKDGRTTAIDYREMAPALATRNIYLDKDGDVIKGEGGSIEGYRAAGVPGTVRGMELALTSAGADGLVQPGQTGPYAHMNLDHYFASWFERFARSFSGTIAGGTSEIQRNIIAQRVLGLPRG